jgi:hypothetical protein
MRKLPFAVDEGEVVNSRTIAWLDLETIAIAQLSSEDPHHPLEDALEEQREGWRALTPGPQVIRFRFDTPQTIKRIQLHFQEAEIERSQEVAIFVTTKRYGRKELLRQQWMFSPNGATSEVEDYTFELEGVTALELQIDPGRHDKQVFATLKSLRIG